MDSSWRRPHSSDRFVENVHQETHHLPSSSGNQRTPLHPGGKGPAPSHPHGGQRPHRPIKPSFESCLNSAPVPHQNSTRPDMHSHNQLEEKPQRTYPRGQYQGSGSISDSTYSSDGRRNMIQPNHRPLVSTYNNVRTEYEGGRVSDISQSMSNSHLRHGKSQWNDDFVDGRESHESYGRSHDGYRDETHRRYHGDSRKRHHDESNGRLQYESHGRYDDESCGRYDKSHGRYHDQLDGRHFDEPHRRHPHGSNERYGHSGNMPHQADHSIHREKTKLHSSHERHRHQSESDLSHHHHHHHPGHSSGGKEKSRLERSRHQSGSSTKMQEDRGRKESGEAPHQRSRHQSESNERHSNKNTDSHRKNNPDTSHHRKRSQSDSSSKYSKIGVVKKKSSDAPKVRSPKKNILPGISTDDDLSASKKKNTMMWLLNSTASTDDDQLAPTTPNPPKVSRQRSNEQMLSPNGENPRASFIVVQDKAGWSKRIYSDGSSGVIMGMEDCRKSPSNSPDTCLKRHTDDERETHLKKKSKAQRRISNACAPHQSGPSYGALLCMAQQNLKNGHVADSKSADKTPERTRRDSHQSSSDPELQRSPSRNLGEDLPKCDFDEEKVERLFKASLSARPKVSQPSAAPEEKQKIKKQASIGSHSSVDSCTSPSKSISKISIEKVGRLFDASLSAKSKTTESPNVPVSDPPQNPLREAQSPERPQYTCTVTSKESSSEQSDNHITMSFRKLPDQTPKKPLGSYHKFHKKSVKRLLLEASSRAVHIPLKRLQLKSDRIFLTDEFLCRLGRSSNVIVNTARKHSPLQGKKQKGLKQELKRRPLHMFSSSDTEAPSTSTNRQALLQRELPLRQALSDSAALSESSISSSVANLFHELSTDPSKTEQTSGSPAGVLGKPRLPASPKFSGSLSKLKQTFGKRLQAAVHGDRQAGQNSVNETDSDLFGSSTGEGNPMGDADYIPFNSGVEDVILEETVTTEVDEEMEVEDENDAVSKDDEQNFSPLIGSTGETMARDASDGASSPESACSSYHTVPSSPAGPCGSVGDQSEDNHADAEPQTEATEATEDDKSAIQSGQQIPEEGSMNSCSSSQSEQGSGQTAGRTGNNGPPLQSSTDSKPDEQNDPDPASEHLASRPGKSKATDKQAAQDLPEDVTTEDTNDGDPTEDESPDDAHNDSESLPDVDLGDDKDSRKDGASQNTLDSMELDLELSMASTTDDSQPANTPTTLLKEVSQIGNKPLPGTPSKPYPYPLNDSMSPGRLSQEQPREEEDEEEETTTKKRKLRFNLDKMMDIKKKTENYAAMFSRLKQDIADGGFARRLTEQPSTEDGDTEISIEEAISTGTVKEHARKYLETKEEQKIPIMHPGEAIFDQTKLQQVFNYDDHMASLAGCGFKPDKPSALESLMLKATPDEMVEMLRTFAVEMAYHSKPCPPTFMLWLFRLMSVHTDCNVVNKAYQTMWSILNMWPIQHPDVQPWAPSVLELTQILVNYGASFTELLPTGLVHPEFEENSIRPSHEEGNSAQSNESSASTLSNEEKARYHGNNLMKVIKMTTVAFITNKTADRFPYSDEDVCCLAVLLCKVSLEKYFISKAVDNDFTLYLVALFECVSEESWKSVAERMCHVLSSVTDHHHNLVYISSLMPACTERGRYMSRQLAYMCLKKLSSDEPEQNANGFYPDLKVEYILDLVPDERPGENTDFYKLHSMIQLLDSAIGNEALEQSEKESLQVLIKKLKLFVTVIRESHTNVTRSQVKDLVVRMTLRLTLMDQAIISDQVNLYHRMLPLVSVKQETIEEHFPQSQEDAVSISSESDGGEDKLDALDEDEAEDAERSKNEEEMEVGGDGVEVDCEKSEAVVEHSKRDSSGNS